MYSIKGIIFDMDNTILKSKIDFTAMKRDIYELLTGRGALEQNFNADGHTSSTMIEKAKQSPVYDSRLDNEVWETAAKHELKGMSDARLEPGVEEVLKCLYGKYKLAVLINNAYAAAITALRVNKAENYFDYIAGREQVPALKPSPAGVQSILRRYPDIKTFEWVSIGDSWIDGRAARDAGVKFISYNGNGKTFKDRGVYPVAALQRMDQFLYYLKIKT